MEITTTMVRFRFPKEAMNVKTDKGQMFLCKKDDTKVKVWVPNSKLVINECKDASDFNEVIMPKWAYCKTDLVLYTEPSEFVVKNEITQEQLNSSINN